jgi:hypothetical protein
MTSTTDLRSDLLAILAEDYTGLPDDYRAAVHICAREGEDDKLRAALELARAGAKGTAIMAALGWED